MWIGRVSMNDFRNYLGADIALVPGLTVVVGANGAGKSNLLEAIGYASCLSSFRGAPVEAMVRDGCERASVRVEGERAGRALLVEAEMTAGGRGRAALNRQPVRRAADLAPAFRSSVFSPDDLELVKGSPALRRRYLDDTLVAIHGRNDLVRRELERIVRQRGALLRQAASARVVSDEILGTLDVWDAKLAETGEVMAAARHALVTRLGPIVADTYGHLAGSSGGADTVLAYEAPWREKGLATSLLEVRPEELRRGVSLVGPHRDDLALGLGSMPARTQASQGEQRCLALALRLAAHDLVTEAAGEAPLLLLDDVFSELDDARSRSLVKLLLGERTGLPAAEQTVLATAVLSAGIKPDRVVRVRDGVIAEEVFS